MKRKGGFIALAVMFSVLLISGCGGGGGGDSSPAAPSAPTGVTATAGDGSVSIGWTAVAGATGYNIYYSTTAGVTKTTGTKVAGVTTPNIVTGLTNGTPYYFVVTAVNAIGEGADSSQVSATPSLAPPVAPTGVTATEGDKEVTIGWSAVAGATSYNIYYSTTAGVTKLTGNKLTGVSSPSIATGLTNNTPYYFVVTAQNAAGEGPVSIEVSATPTPAPPPPPPAVVSASAGHGEATISWSPVTGATSYNIYFDNTIGVTKSSLNKLTGVSSPRIVTGLINGTQYYFVVTAENASGESVESIEVSATPTPLPALSAPTNVTATPGPANATISWDNVTDATSYNVYYSTTSGVTKTTGTKVAGVTSPNDINGLIRGTPYYFVVTSLNSDNVESVDSSQASATPAPPNPTFSQADLTGIWTVRVILSGTSPGWYGITATVDSSGNVSTSLPVGPTAAPTVSVLSITSGTGSTAGVVTETGPGSNETFFGKMSTSKNLIVGVSTIPGGTTFALHVFVKRVPGVTFSSADLANTTIVYQKIYRGVSNANAWERGTGSIDGTGQMTLTAVDNNSGSVSPLPSPTGILVDSTTGIVTIGADSSFSGVMTPDKKIIVGTSGASAPYSLRIIQMRGQTYTLADLAGTNHAFAFLARSTSSSWARAVWTTDGAGNVTYPSILNSNGVVDPPGSFTQTMDPQGNVPSGTLGGTLSFGKDLLVSTGTLPPPNGGTYFEVKVQ